MLFPWLWLMAGSGGGTPATPVSGVAFDLDVQPAASFGFRAEPRAGLSAAVDPAVGFDADVVRL